MPGLNQASSAVPGPITAPGKTPGWHTHLPKHQRPEEGEFPMRNGAPASPAACDDARRYIMEASGHSGKTEQEDILERHNKRTFWKDRTRKGHSGKTEQEKDILERQNKKRSTRGSRPSTSVRDR